MLLLFIVGDILGGGIYAGTGEVAGEIGGAIWTGFALAGVIAAFTAAVVRRAGVQSPQAAGAALYIHKAFKAPLLTFVVAFAVMCRGVSSAAALATAFGGDYLSEFVELPTVLVALAVIRVVSVINFRGIKESANFNLGCTLIELGGLFLVVVIGAAFLFDGGGDAGRALEFKDDANPALLMIAGASIAFYALIGFEDAVNVAEETKDATKSFPRTLFIGLGLAGAVYLLVTVVAGMAVPADTLAEVRRPAAGDRHPGPAERQLAGLLRDRAVRDRQRLPAEPGDGVAADVRHGQRAGRPGDPRQGPLVAPDAVRGDPVHRVDRRRAGDPRRPRPRWPTRPCCCC